jgi:hypothetical protein
MKTSATPGAVDAPWQESSDPLVRFSSIVRSQPANKTPKQHEKEMRELVRYVAAAFPSRKTELQSIVDEAFSKRSA